MKKRPLSDGQALRSVTVEVNMGLINPKYRPYLSCEKRYLIFYGGAGSGKSYFLAQRYILRLLQKKRCNLLAVRRVQRTNRDSTFALLRQVIAAWGLMEYFHVTESDMRIVCTWNGNSVLFAGVDDSEKLKSITFENGELTDVWIEEASELTEADFNQLDIRLRGGHTNKQICISFNPINANHWLKRRFFDRRCAQAAIVHSTYHDNRFLDDAYRGLLESYRKSDPYYYEVYCLGQWGVFGRTVFDARAVHQRIQKLHTDGIRGRFVFEYDIDPIRAERVIRPESVCFEADENGEIVVYIPPEEGVPYVVGADTAGEGSDWFAAQVLNNCSGEQVAVLHSQTDEDVFAQQLFCLGVYYQNALIGIESNFSTYPIRELERLGYTNQYVRETEDRFTHRLTQSYGVRTTALTRPIMLATLVRVVRDQTDCLNDSDTLQELLTFVRNEKGRAEAQANAHDDLVMALAIAHYIRPQQQNVRTERPTQCAKLPPELQTGDDIMESEVMTW